MSSSGVPRGRGRGGNSSGGANGRRKPQQNGTGQTSNGRSGGPKGGRGQGRGKGAGPAPNKKRNSLSAALQTKINEIQSITGSYFSVETITSHLQNSNNDVDAALQSLNNLKTNSWSSVVSKDQGKPFERAQKQTPPPENASAQKPAPANPKPTKNGKANGKGKPQQQKRNKSNKTAPAPTPESARVPVAAIVQELDPDAKIVELSKRFNDSLREIESKSQLLKTMQQEVQAISAQRDATIDQLNAEKDNLIARRVSIQEELKQITERLAAIDVEVEHLREEKIQKVQYLEQKSRELLG